MSETPPRRGRKRRAAGQMVSAVLVGAAIWFLFRTGSQVGWDQVGDRLRAADPLVLAGVVLVTLGRNAVWALRWQLLARPATAFPWWPAHKALMASLFITTVVPGSRSFGGLVRARHLARACGRPMGPFYGGALVDQIGYSIISMVMGAIFVLGYWGERSGVGNKGFWLAAAGLLGGVALGVLYHRREQVLERLRRRSARLADGVQGTMSVARQLLARGGSWPIIGAGGLLVYGANIVAIQLGALALGAPMSFAAAAGAFSVGALAGTVANTPGGLGATEYAAVEFLGRAAGIEPDVALGSVLLARGAHYICSLVFGGIFTFSRGGGGLADGQRTS